LTVVAPPGRARTAWLLFRLFCLAGLCAVAPARADIYDTLNLNTSVTAQYDSNLFRLSAGADANALVGKPSAAEQVLVSSFGFKLAKPYSLQRFEFEANLVDYKYRKFSYLDSTALNYAGAWRWSLTPRAYGNLTRTRTQALNSFADFTGFGIRNLRTDENTRLDGSYELDGVWRLIGAAAEITRTNSQPFVQEGDNSLRTIEGGPRYVAPSGTTLSYVARSGRGVFFNRPQPIAAALLDNRFEQREHEFSLLWLISGKSNVTARVAHVDRKHANFSARDHGGNVANLSFNWGVSGKLRLTTTWSRELASFQSPSASYTSTERWVFNPVWQISEKTALRGRYDRSVRDFRGAVAVTPQNDRSDLLRSAQISLDWKPLRALTFTATLQNDRRASNLPGLDFNSVMVSLTVLASF